MRNLFWLVNQTCVLVNGLVTWKVSLKPYFSVFGLTWFWTQHKDLGVILDTSLTLTIISLQLSLLVIMSRPGQINRVKHCFDERTLILIINALVFSRLFYCSSVWSNTSQSNIAKLQAVQNFAHRTASGSKTIMLLPFSGNSTGSPWNNICIIAIQSWHLNTWMALFRGIYLISLLSVYQYQHAKIN